MWYRLFKYVLLGPALWVSCRPRIVGRDLLPATGLVIVAATHSAFIDSLLLCLVLPRRLTFVAKSDYFDRPGLRGRMQRWFFLAAGQIPIDRSGGDRAATTLATAISLVSGGGAWAIHPEGTRSCDGRVHRGHTGVMRVARATGAPVVPIALRGTERVNPPGSSDVAPASGRHRHRIPSSRRPDNGGRRFTERHRSPDDRSRGNGGAAL